MKKIVELMHVIALGLRDRLYAESLSPQSIASRAKYSWSPMRSVCGSRKLNARIAFLVLPYLGIAIGAMMRGVKITGNRFPVILTPPSVQESENRLTFTGIDRILTLKTESDIVHNIEPFFNWRYLYVSEEDEHSPFYGRTYSEFEFSNTVYNYYIHPQWDNFGSGTLFCKILYADYDLQFCVIELIGEWNDAIENDVMTLRYNLTDFLFDKGIKHFILIGENVLNFHASDAEYYEQWYEEISEVDGWVVLLNLPRHSEEEFKKYKLQYYVELMHIEDWRVYKPHHLFQKIDRIISSRLE